ncbi:MAG: T9SS type A sorting domain-containing protein [Bacteroidales bacterium]|nr:T9SS type A sorting domain-containing protein [Bacteroidales bacterium]
MKKILITTILFATGLMLQAQNIYVQPITGDQIPFVMAETKITFADRVMTVGESTFPLAEVRNLSFVEIKGEGPMDPETDWIVQIHGNAISGTTVWTNAVANFTSGNAGTYVWTIPSVEMHGGRDFGIQIMVDGSQFLLLNFGTQPAIVITGDTENFSGTGNVRVGETKTYTNVTITIVWNGTDVTSTTVNFPVPPPTAIAPIADNQIHVFPNPVRDELTIAVSEFMQDMTFSLFDLNGRLMQTGRILSETTTIDMQNHPSGTYILFVEQGGVRIQSFQIIKQ